MPMGTGNDDTGHTRRGPQGGPAGELYTPDGGKTWLERPVEQSDVASRAAQIRELIGNLPPEARGEFSNQSALSAQPAAQPAQPVYAGPTPPVMDTESPFFSAPAASAAARAVSAYPPAQYAGVQDDATVDPADPSLSTDPNVNPNAPFSHWLHLANGEVRKSIGTVTHWHEDDDPRTPGIPIVAVVANPAYVQGAGDRRAQVRALLAELAGLTGIDLSNLANSL